MKFLGTALLLLLSISARGATDEFGYTPAYACPGTPVAVVSRGKNLYLKKRLSQPAGLNNIYTKFRRIGPAVQMGVNRFDCGDAQLTLTSGAISSASLSINGKTFSCFENVTL